jgi:hypothetical protein
VDGAEGGLPLWSAKKEVSVGVFVPSGHCGAGPGRDGEGGVVTSLYLSLHFCLGLTVSLSCLPLSSSLSLCLCFFLSLSALCLTLSISLYPVIHVWLFGHSP